MKVHLLTKRRVLSGFRSENDFEEEGLQRVTKESQKKALILLPLGSYSTERKCISTVELLFCLLQVI